MKDSVVKRVGVTRGYDVEQRRSVANLLFDLAGRLSSALKCFQQVVCWIVEGQARAPHLDAIVEYVKKHGDPSTEEIEANCGIGQFVDEGEVKSVIKELLDENMGELKEKRYQMVSWLHSQLRLRLPWADRALVNRELMNRLNETIGPKQDGEVQRVSAKRPSGKKKSSPSAEAGSEASRISESIAFPMPCENTNQDLRLLKEHLERTGGIVITRFPPEPNGFLHIGHAKAMNLNFGYASKMNGKCYLRFDDTNPAAETQEYIDSIIDMTEWLGYKPHAVTYASDYFGKLYDLAVELIKRGKAFVCHQRPEEYRGLNDVEAKKSPWRDRPIEENLKLFRDMKNGKLREGEASLRMKMDIESPNPCMWDLVAYRIKYHPHPRTGDQWCIYPSYDFTHCINDSLEDITHSLCTLEYVPRNQSYYWLLDALQLYRPLVWEYGRLNLTHTVLSKRVLVRLVNEKIVSGFDDPRMPTLSGYRRRGYTSRAINRFCEDVGVTRADGVFIPISRLEHALREDLDSRAPRLMAVLYPLKVIISNLDESIQVTRQNIPGFPEKGSNTVDLTKVIYIDKADFREHDVPNFHNLALHTSSGKLKWVRLRYGPVIAVTDVMRSDSGEITELIAVHDPHATKSSGTIHWVSAPDQPCPNGPSLKAEFRLYDHLFKSEKPASLKDAALFNDVNPDSLVITHGYVDSTASKLKAWDHVQFERLGFFNVDPDSFKDHPLQLIFNRSVPLNEAKDKPK
ncbi:probable glutamine--tRNA ligase isoform X2 [Schistocerca gregaria]|uniref:probable glutamine--tRNA ligase isoform X2 n=1 Tax=Schistocerca gregaria TaxID=7010 RepID=UPI00211E6688|nr:probable glutamine--tRNA ligase isoform X2 [Schistocerca gregaria]